MTNDEMMLLPASKQRAILANSLYYFTGKKCRKGHLFYRYTSSGNCVQCIAEKRNKPRITSKGKPRVCAENQRRADQALELALTFYTPQKPCKHGHLKRCATTHNCIPCVDNNQRRNKNRKWQRLKRVYGLSKGDFFNLLYGQSEKCAICEKNISENNCHVDHCHKNNHVRGLLCSRCNQAIGLFSERKDVMEKAIRYIKEKS